MKNLSKLTKGILLTALAVTVFCVNVGPIAPSPETKAITNQESQISNLFVEKAYAQAPASGGSSTPAQTSGSTSATTGGGKTDVSSKPASPLDARKLIDAISKASTLINSVFNPLILYVTRMIGGLLNNDYIFGGSMGEMLHGIWVVSRNIVNIAFVLILLFLALRHIFGGEENTDLKKTMPIFVIMLIAVNFSWLATRVVLDAANVATNVVFAIPSGVKGVVGKDLKLGDVKCEISSDNKRVIGGCEPKKMWIPLDATETHHQICDDATIKKYDQNYLDAYPVGGGPPSPSGLKVLNKKIFCWNNLDISKFQQDNAAYYLTYSMANVQNLAVANTGDSISKVGIGTLFGIVIQIVYLVAFVSLFIALIIRVAVIWLLVATSPFIVLFLFLEKASIKAGTEGEIKDWISPGSFASWAFAPAKVAAIWSIGFIMVTSGQTVSKSFFATLDKQGSVNSEVFSINSLFMGMETIQEFIWLLMTIGIVWMGTFAVLTKLKVGGSLFEGIKRQGTELARWVGRSPKWAPIIPMLDDKGNLDWSRRAGLGGMLPTDWTQKIEQYYTGKADMARKASDAGYKLKNLSTSEIKDINNAEKNSGVALKALTSRGGISTAELSKLTENQIGDMLRDSKKFDKDKIPGIAKAIKIEADRVSKGEKLPGTKPAPKAVAGAVIPPGQIATEVEQGVKNVITNEKIKAEMTNLDAKDIQEKAAARAKKALEGKPNVTRDVALAEARKAVETEIAAAKQAKGLATGKGTPAAPKKEGDQPAAKPPEPKPPAAGT